MTRAEITTELDRVACEWRVPLKVLRGNGKHGGRVCGIVAAARAVFAKRMFVEGVQPGHVAWALDVSPQCAARWFKRFRKAEQQWWVE
jgi:hypothetical protein